MKRIKLMGIAAIALCMSVILTGCFGLQVTSTVTERIIPEEGYTERTLNGVDMYVPETWTYYFDTAHGVPSYISGVVGSSSSVNVVQANGTADVRNERKANYLSLYRNQWAGTINIPTFTLVDFHGDLMLYVKVTITQSGQTFHMWQLVVSKDNTIRVVTMMIIPGHDTAIADNIYNSLQFN